LQKKTRGNNKKAGEKCKEIDCESNANAKTNASGTYQWLSSRLFRTRFPVSISASWPVLSLSLSLCLPRAGAPTSIAICLPRSGRRRRAYLRVYL